MSTGHTLRGLKMTASIQAPRRGHTLKPWPKDDDGRFTHTTCRECGGTVVLDTEDPRGVWGVGVYADCATVRINVYPPAGLEPERLARELDYDWSEERTAYDADQALQPVEDEVI